MDGSTALSIYREEKARALQERRISHAQLMAEAKEAFAKMLADAQLARKGGRPRTNPQAAPAAASAAAAKAKPAVALPPKKAVAVNVAPPKGVGLKAKAAPVKKASAKKLRLVAKRAQRAPHKTTLSAKGAGAKRSAG